MIQQYALVENGQITRTEFFKRPNLVPAGDWRVIGEVTPDYDAATHQLGGKTLQVLPDGSVAYVWSVVAIPPPPVRQRVTKAALKMAAGQAGLLGPVNDFIAQLPYDAPAVILWNDAGDFKRSDALWDFMAAQFGVTSGDVDDLFNMAGQIDDSFGGGLL